MLHNRFIVFVLLLLINRSVIQAAQIDVSLTHVELPSAVATQDGENKSTTTALVPTFVAATPPTNTTMITTSTSSSTTTTTQKKAPVDTTTAAPTTSTTAAPAPTPYPEPSIGQWNSSCIMVKMAAQLNITYETKDKNTSTALYNVPSNAIYYNGRCKTVTQVIQVKWGAPEAQGSMLLEFDLKNQIAQLTMLRFVIPIVGEQFPNASENQTLFLLHMGNDFRYPLQMSYHCKRSQLFYLTETLIDTEIVGSVTVHDVQVEAFRSSSNTNAFSPASECETTPGIVPIAVGIVLVGMIVIILTWYFYARRRSNSLVYMSF